MKNKVSFINDYDEGLNAFISACNDMLSAKYLLAERKISAVLASIASCERLYSLFSQVLKGYNRQVEWKKSIVTVGGRNKLVLPQSQTKLMAYSFCLLMELDAGKKNLRELLDEYFFHTNPNEEYVLFCKAIIAPFRDVTEFVFINGIDSFEEEDGFDVTLRESVKELLQKLSSIINQTTVIDVSIKQDLFMLARAIESSLTPNRIDLVKPLLTGYRNTVNACALRETLLPIVDELFRVFVTGDIF